MEEIPCIIHPVKFLCLEGEACSGCSVLDVSFSNGGNGVKVSEISFENFYTASISIKGKSITDGSFRSLISKYTLMTSPHYANEAQYNFNLVLAEETCRHGDEEYVEFRFILRQPSPRWQVFTIENLKFFRQMKNQPMTPKPELTGEKTREKSQLSMDRLSEHLQTMKSMVELFHRLPEEYEPPSFEMGGTYDVNLLSYS